MTDDTHNARPFELGIYSFAELTPDPVTGEQISPAQRLHNLMEAIELADQVGLDVFGLGEHHRPDFVSSAPAVILGAIAARTQSIRLSTAVTVLSSDDPVRVFQDFATLDLLSNGRAEIMAGRGSFIESYPLFGYNLDDYNELFAEKLDLLLKLRESERITWSGKHRAALNGQGVYPRPVQEPHPRVDRGGRHAGLGRARRHAGPADGARHHRRTAGTLCAVCGTLSPVAARGGPRPGAGSPEHQLPRLPGRRLGARPRTTTSPATS